MTGLEPVVMAIGKSLATKAGQTWLASQAASSDRDKDLVSLINLSFRDKISRRRVQRQIDDIADSVAERLLPLCRQEFRGLSDNDKAAVVIGVKKTLTDADFSDQALFSADADPLKLSAGLRKQLGSRTAETEFGEAGGNFYFILLDECCDLLIRIISQLPQFGPRATQDVLARLSTLAANVDVALSRLPVRSLDAPQGREDDAEFRRRYLEHISSTLDYSELFGVNFERYRPLTALSVSYISLSVTANGNARDRHRSPRGIDRELWLSGWREEQELRELPTIRVEAALSASRRMIIRGEAGSGKTTLLRWLAVTAARGTFISELEKWNGSIPFFVRLRSYAEHGLPSPEDFLSGTADPIKGLMPVGWVHRQLSHSKAMLLVDGVDELAGPQRRAVRSWLANLLVAYPEIQVVVTSRPAAASADWLAAEGFNSAFLERMSPADVRSLIRHWHVAARDASGLPCDPDQLPSYEASLLARLEAAPHLRSLAGTPLLAALLCALNLDRVRQLPRDRMSLYAAALDMLVNRRDLERGVLDDAEISIEPGQKIQLLQILASRLSTTNRSELPKTTVIQCVGHTIETMPRASGLEAESVVNYLLQRSGVLREPIQGRIDFIHRTIQEYLTAKQLADEGDMDLLIRSAHKYQWYDTVIMAAGHANAPLRRELMLGLLLRAEQEPTNARRLKLVIAACLETLNSLPEDLSLVVSRCLEDLIPPRDGRAARSLAAVGEPVLEKLPENIQDLSDGVARATVRTAWLINGPGALDVLNRYRDDPRMNVQSELISGWPYFDAFEYVKKVLGDAPLIAGTATIVNASCLPAVKGLSNLRALGIDVPELQDLSLLAELPHIFMISINRLGSADLQPLRAHRTTLEYLHLGHNPQIKDYSPIKELIKLSSLDLDIQGTTNLTFVKNLPELGRLGLFGLDELTDYSALQEIPSLKALTLGGCVKLTNVDQLPLSDQLTDLFLRYANLANGLPIIVDRTPNLTELTLDFCDWVSDLSSLADSKLRTLRLWGCQNVADVRPLSTLTNLTSLDLDKTSVADISALENLVNLETLWLKDCSEITDLSVLANFSKLKELYIQGIEPDADLSPLANNRRVLVHLYDGQRVKGHEALGKQLIRTAD